MVRLFAGLMPVLCRDSNADLEYFTDQQLGQLYELMQAIKKKGQEDGDSDPEKSK